MDMDSIESINGDDDVHSLELLSDQDELFRELDLALPDFDLPRHHPPEHTPQMYHVAAEPRDGQEELELFCGMSESRMYQEILALEHAIALRDGNDSLNLLNSRGQGHFNYHAGSEINHLDQLDRRNEHPSRRALGNEIYNSTLGSESPSRRALGYESFYRLGFRTSRHSTDPEQEISESDDDDESQDDIPPIEVDPRFPTLASIFYAITDSAWAVLEICKEVGSY